MSDSDSDVQAGESELGSKVLNISGGKSKTKTPEERDEPYRTIAISFQVATDSAKDIIPVKQRAEYVGKSRANALYKAFTLALDNEDEQTARDKLAEYEQLMKDAIAEFRLVAKFKGQQCYRFQQNLLDLSGWRNLAKLEAEWETAQKECLDTIKLAKTTYKNNDVKLNDIGKGERQVTEYLKALKGLRDNEMLNVLEVPGIVEANDKSPGSLAWFSAIQDEVEEAPEAEAEDPVRVQGERDWAEVLDDIADKWGDFRDSNYNFAYRGPTMPGKYSTPYITAKFKNGRSYNIGGKVYVAGPSDTGGMSLKTSFPKSKQGYNANGGWVQSFIYHAK